MAKYKYEIKSFPPKVLDRIGGGLKMSRLQIEIEELQDRDYELFSVLPKVTRDGYVAIFRKPLPTRSG